MFSEGMEFGFYDKAERKATEAHELYEDGQMSQALEELDTALEINPANSAWHFDKALALDSIQRFEEAITEYELALDLCQSDLEILNSLAVDYTRTGQYDRAIETFEYIERQDSEFEPSYCNRIIAYTEMGLHDRAEEMFYLAQQVNSGCALCYYNIGNSLFVRGQYQKAIGCWIKTAELESTHPQINYRIAQAYWYENDHVLARKHFLCELRCNPADLDVILDFGLFLLERGEIEPAKEKFNRILEFEPDHAQAIFFLGEIAFHSGDLERALDMYNSALRYDDALAGPYYRLAQHALSQGKKKKTRAYLLSELRNNSENAALLTSIGSMFLSMACSEKTDQGPRVPPPGHSASSDLDHAVHCLLKAVDNDHARPDTYYFLGVASATRGDFEDASEFFVHALELKEDYVPALQGLVRVRLYQGNYTQASKYLGKARAIAPSDPLGKRLAWEIQWYRIYSGIEVLGNQFNSHLKRIQARIPQRRAR
jgi:tetratricopeptide (TPR) repeat protein